MSDERMFTILLYFALLVALAVAVQGFFYSLMKHFTKAPETSRRRLVGEFSLATHDWRKDLLFGIALCVVVTGALAEVGAL